MCASAVRGLHDDPLVGRKKITTRKASEFSAYVQTTCALRRALIRQSAQFSSRHKKLHAKKERMPPTSIHTVLKGDGLYFEEYYRTPCVHPSVSAYSAIVFSDSAQFNSQYGICTNRNKKHRNIQFYDRLMRWLKYITFVPLKSIWCNSINFLLTNRILHCERSRLITRLSSVELDLDVIHVESLHVLFAHLTGDRCLTAAVVECFG